MLEKGTVLDGKYEILKEIGEGGMSVVYLARNNRLNMQLAVKEIKNDGSKSVEILLKGLEREANILKNVDHPVIPRIIDIVKYENTICVVMDFIEGENLLDHLKKNGPVDQEQVIDWGLELAGALQYLHSMNPPIIYRDMKPANVMLKPEGGVKLIDFGTAKTYTIENNADTTALGTRGYAAPEQFGDAKGRGIYKTDARTDIYNLGATMYHMVTGKNPQEPPYEMVPIRQVNPALSTGLEQIILKCTRPNPNDRYQSCNELIYALEHYTELDDSFKKKNKQKVGLFLTCAALTLVFGAVSIIGKAGMDRVTRNDYYKYITQGDKYKAIRTYEQAAEEYQRAYALKPGESDAYLQLIQLYIAEANDTANQEGTNREEIIMNGLNLVAAQISNKSIDAEDNSDVIYRMGYTYFSELGDYQSASQYFSMIPKESKYYDDAQNYGSISDMLSQPNPDVDSLMTKVNGFADEVMNSTTYNKEKFDNYKTLGSVYVRYLSNAGVAEQAEKVMTKATEDIEKIDQNVDSAEYMYAFNDNLSEIYYTIGQKAMKDDPNKAKDYLNLSVISCKEVVSLAQANIADMKSLADNDITQSYINKYIDKTCRIAEINGLLAQLEGNPTGGSYYDEAIKTYEDAEKKLGTSNQNAKKVFTSHLNFLYSAYETKYGNDPATWGAADVTKIVKVYDEGNNVPGIGKDHNWATRVSTLDSLKNGDLVVDEDASATDASANKKGE